MERVEDIDQFEYVLEFMKIENDHNRAVETNAWTAIGMFDLVDYDKTDISGYQPVFELCDNKKLELFRKQNDNCSVVITRQIEVDGVWTVDESLEPMFGTLRLHKEHLNRATAKLSQDCRIQFETLFEINQKFAFTSGFTDRALSFWRKKNHLKMPLFRVTKVENDPSSDLQRLIKGQEMDPEAIKNITDRGTAQFDLNESQFKAVKMALNDKRPLVCIEGAAGTGKTYVLAALLVKLIDKKKKVLVLTPTIEALKKLKAMTEEMLIKKKVKFHENSLMDVEKFQKAKNSSPEGIETMNLVEKLREQLKNKEISADEYVEMAQYIIDDNTSEIEKKIMSDVNVIFATPRSVLVKKATMYSDFEPCMCIIDEANQVMETQAWPAVIKMKRIIMAGDPMQLPPYVITPEGKDAKLNTSIIERIIEQKEKFSWIMLDQQYRCHPQISEWPSGAFYGGKLINKTCHSEDLHSRFNKKVPTEFKNLFDPLVLIDTSLERRPDVKMETYEQYIETNGANEDATFSNIAEAKLVLSHYRHLRDLGISANDIAIITPYKGQFDLLKKSIASLSDIYPDYTDSKIGTIDSVQGQEWDVVIFSMVRSNPKFTLGFVSETRRLNVAVTRAKRHFAMIGNGAMLARSNHAEIRGLFDCLRNPYGGKKHRFHPEHASYTSGFNESSHTDRVSNNFGEFFDSFMETTRDPEMRGWCKRFKEKGEEHKARKEDTTKAENKLAKQAKKERAKKYSKRVAGSEKGNC